MDRIIHAQCTLLKKGNNTPLNENGVVVRLYDKDLVNDDFLGEAVPDADGVARFTFTEKDLRSADSPFERLGDLYFVVRINGSEVYRSPVADDLDPAVDGSFSTKEGHRLDLGTYLV